MSRHSPRFARTLAIALLALAPLSLSAQRVASAPKRPHLAGVVDTNDAHAYFDFGMQVADNAPDDAANAFYWAARIDPGLAGALYGRRVAILMSQEALLRQVMTGRGKSKQEQALDSLQLRAVMLDPFLYRRLDVQLLTKYYQQAIETNVRQSGGDPASMRSELSYHLNVWLQQAGPYMRGWMAYGQGNFDHALSQYAEAEKQTKEKAGLRVERGRIFGMRGDADSAIAEFKLALDEMRKRDAKDVVVLYNSKAVLEQAIGMLLEQKNDMAGAREAYGRALQEDLAYWPAHVRLGFTAVSAGDTAAAVSEFALATQIAADEPYVRALVGSALVNLGKATEGLDELNKAIAMEPLYALPHIIVARLYEAASFRDEAIASYTAFLARASRNDPQRQMAEQRLAALKSSGGTQ